jgi:hypothetical protein
MSDINYENHNLPHWAEVRDENGGTIWKSYDRALPLTEIYSANKVIRRNKDGSYEYIKNRGANYFGMMTEQEEKEFMFIMISAERYRWRKWYEIVGED